MGEEGDISLLYTNHKDMKPHFINMIQSFQSKTSAECLSLFMNHNKAAEEYGPISLEGYQIPLEGEVPELLSGLKSWPSLYSYPEVSFPK